MRLRESRTWLLRDLLGMAGEPPTCADPSEDPETWYLPIVRVQHPTLVGRRTRKMGTTLHLEGKRGLPEHLHDEERRALWRVIQQQTATTTGEDPVLNWALPVRCASQMKLTLTDPQELPCSPRRIQKIILRAMPEYQGKHPPHPMLTNVTLCCVGQSKCYILLRECYVTPHYMLPHATFI